MSKCEECGQDKPPTDEDMLGWRLDCYRSAFGVLKDLWKKEPSTYEVLTTARFLAQDNTMSVFTSAGEDDDDDD